MCTLCKSDAVGNEMLVKSVHKKKERNSLKTDLYPAQFSFNEVPKTKKLNNIYKHELTCCIYYN